MYVFNTNGRKLADVAERLRRLTRNQFPSGSVGSIPTVCVILLAYIVSLNLAVKIIFINPKLASIISHHTTRKTTSCYNGCGLLIASEYH